MSAARSSLLSLPTLTLVLTLLLPPGFLLAAEQPFYDLDFADNAGATFAVDEFGAGVDGADFGPNGTIADGSTLSVSSGTGWVIRSTGAQDYSQDGDGYFFYLRNGDDMCLQLATGTFDVGATYEICYYAASWDDDGTAALEAGTSIDTRHIVDTEVYGNVTGHALDGFLHWYRDAGESTVPAAQGDLNGYAGNYHNGYLPEITDGVFGNLTPSNTLNWKKVVMRFTARATDEDIWLSKLGGSDRPLPSEDGGLALDHITITKPLCDHGDLADVSSGTGAGDYQTLLAHDGPRHTIIEGLHLGSAVDPEGDGLPSVGADGDDTPPSSLVAVDDEDGITLPTYLCAGESHDIGVAVTNTTGSTAHLEAWIDWNGDGDFADTNEMVIDTDDSGGAFPATMTINVPSTAVIGTTVGARFRLSHTDGMTPNGLMAAGEVEDNLIEIKLPVGLGNLVFQDLNANGQYDSGEGVDGVVLELWDPVDGTIGNGDDVAVDDPHQLGTQAYTVTTTGGGCYLFSHLIDGNYYVRIPASEFAGGEPLESMVSVTGTQVGDDDAGEDGIDDVTPATNGITSGVVALMNDSEPTDGGSGALAETGKDHASDNGDDDNTDLTVDFGFVAPVMASYDYGDLPEGGGKDFPTAGSSAGEYARHQLGSGILLGSKVDAESNGQPNVTASGDGNDEDGFASLPDLAPGATYAIPFTAAVPSGAPVLNAWIDFDCDGMLEAGEQIASDLAVTDGANTLTFTVPGDAIPGVAYARFRLSTETGLQPTGEAADGEVEDYGLTILPPTGAIGNLVWLDENSDGAQDAGEPGLPNIEVQLWLDEDGGGRDILIGTTLTDTHGRYLFPGLPVGCYYVDIEDISVPTSLSPTTVFAHVVDGSDVDLDTDDGDFGNKDHAGDGYKVQLDPNETNLTADFGYNENPTADVDGGTNTAAIGNKVWHDTDGNGVQDPHEVGIEGVVVELVTAGPDRLFHTADDVVGVGIDGVLGTADDVPAYLTTTDSLGCYLFDGLSPDAYCVKVVDENFAGIGPLNGLTQTGDPDHFGGTGTGDDNETTSPVFLGPGDVFLNADFGYSGGVTGSIGDKVWLDANASGGGETTMTADGESGIPGVTVALIQDLNENSVRDAGEPILATDTTDSAGCYLFEGLPVDADGKHYLIWINDTAHVLQGLNQTHDDDGSLDGMSEAVLTTAAPDHLDEDFSFTAIHPSGSIGDTIWADWDSSGGNQQTQGSEPGIPSVTVLLLGDPGPDGNWRTADDVVAAETETNQSGEYLFSNLPFGTYAVVVDDGDDDLLNEYFDIPSYDPDGGFDSLAVVTISASAPHARDQDFSFPPGGEEGGFVSIGDKVYYDTNGDGSQDRDGADDMLGTADDEPGIPGIDVVLGGAATATATTDEDGCYLFPALSPGTYTITVTNPPAGTTQTEDPNGGADNTSSVTLMEGDHVRDQDFGYQPAGTLYSIGNTIWLDLDGDGDAADDPNESGTEPALDGVTVYLCLKGPDGTFGTADDVLLATETTDSTGYYQFSGLSGGVDYQVKVDTSTLPDGVSPLSSFENDASFDSTTTVTGLAAHEVDEDFAYPLLGAIGDTVFLDGNGNAVADDGEGLEGVRVRLCDSSGTVTLAETTTDGNGRYLFDDVAAGDYVVKVDPNDDTLPSGVTNAADPDDGTPDESHVTLGVAEVDLAQDFGYTGADGRIGNLVWLDRDADGLYEPSDGETPIGGVTIDLYRDANGNGFRDPGESQVASTTTSAAVAGAFGTDGNYCFDNLPSGDYVVQVSDRAGILAGYWHSLGTADTDNHSQAEAYAIGLSAGDAKTADFGYYVDPAFIGNYVWIDADDDGLQESSENGIPNVEVQLVIAYPDGSSITHKTLTNSLGHYQFGNLLLDEDNRCGDGPTTDPNAPAIADDPTQPLFTVSVDTGQSAVASFTPSSKTNVGVDDRMDSDLHAGVVAKPVQGQTVVGAQDPASNEGANASYDFAFVAPVYAIKGQVRNDADQDGDVAEAGVPISGVTVLLYQDVNNNGLAEEGELVEGLVTDSDGRYCFEGYPNGNYIVREIDPDNAISTGDKDGGSTTDERNTIPVTLADANSEDNDFLDDLDPQGFFYKSDTGEIVPGGSISVSGPGGAIITIKQDGSSGQYEWLTDTPGTYTVIYTPPAGCMLDPARPAEGSALDPTGQPDPFSVGSPEDPSNPGFLTDASSGANPWYDTFDLDVGDPIVINNNIPLVNGKPDDWVEWQDAYTLGGSNAPGDNPDGDIWDNTLEYALCLEPDTGVPGHVGFCVEAISATQIDVFFRRREGGLTDVRYCIEARDQLPTTGDTAWTLIADIPGIGNGGLPGVTVTANGDGSETVRLADIDTTAPLSSTQGFVRLTVKLDDDGDDGAVTPAITSSTMVQGWKLTDFAQGECVTYSYPWLKKETFSGSLSAVSGQTVTAAGAPDLSTILEGGKSYYLEVISGDHEGHRFDIDSANAAGILTLATDTDVCAGPPFSSSATVPATLVNDRFIVREHQTVEDLFPAAAFTGESDSELADRLLIYEGGALPWKVLYVDDPAEWKNESNDASAGDDVLPPSQGYFVHPKLGAFSLLAMGVVRENNFCIPLGDGHRMLANGFPMNTSFADRGLDDVINQVTGSLDPAASDQVHLWNGDAAPYQESFDCHFRLEGSIPSLPAFNQWSDVEDVDLTDTTNDEVFTSDRSIFYYKASPGCDADHKQPLPWLP